MADPPGRPMGAGRLDVRAGMTEVHEACLRESQRVGEYMPHPQFDRFRVRMQPLSARNHKFEIEQVAVRHDQAKGSPSPEFDQAMSVLAERVRTARRTDRPVICAFGAHAIKNGLGPVLTNLMEGGWLTHLATNGAGVIHDWEFSFAGKSCEDVRQMVSEGRFGNWEETGFLINLALNLGSYQGLGYGESMGAMIWTEGLEIPCSDELEQVVAHSLAGDPQQAAAAADLLGIVRRFGLKPGRMQVPHPWKAFSAQASGYRLGIPFTGHPMFGHDIIYNHPMNHGASLGRCAERDFLTFADSVSRIEGGVYISMGSAVMSPMIFEKSLSMAQNISWQQGRPLGDFTIFVVDLAASGWDWSRREPPVENPAYYLRYNKTFSRMGGTMHYLQADNREVLMALVQRLAGALPATEGST